MKLRVKWQSNSQVIDLEGREPSDITLAQLKEAVTANLNLQNYEFWLSLNKSDALPSDEQSLSSVGIVSGDLLHVIGPDLPQVTSARSQPRPGQPLGSHVTGSAAGPSQQHSDTSIMAVESGAIHGDMETEQGNVNDLSPPNPDTLVNRYLSEPLVMRESTATQVPALLEQLYLSAACCSMADALWVALHTLMLEAGFSPLEVSETSQMPTGWKQTGFYRSSYQLNLPGGEKSAQGSVVGLSVGSSLVVHGLVSGESSFKTEQLQLKSADYVDSLSENVPNVYVALDRLSRTFKDTICLPLENELVTVAGIPGGQGFVSLPYEVKIRILSSLDAATVCHLGQASSEMSVLVKDKVVWRLLYIRDFGKPSNSALTRDWYELYKEKVLAQREEERRRQERALEYERFRHHLGFVDEFRRPGFGHMPPHPHFIGGDYDLNPDFAAGGIPNPMGNSPNRGGPLLPGSGLPGPHLGDLDPLGSYGRLGGRGNLIGSPFGRGGFGGGGSMFRTPFM